MTYFPDLAPCDYFFPLTGKKLKAVGWLDAAHPFPTGRSDAELFDRLFQLADAPWEPFHFLGFHECELCDEPDFGIRMVHQGRQRFLGAHNLFIPGQDVVYVAPSLVLHYIQSHQYQPPREFTEAVLACPRMHSAEYMDALRRNGPDLSAFIHQ